MNKMFKVLPLVAAIFVGACATAPNTTGMTDEEVAIITEVAVQVVVARISPENRDKIAQVVTGVKDNLDVSTKQVMIATANAYIDESTLIDSDKVAAKALVALAVSRVKVVEDTPEYKEQVVKYLDMVLRYVGK